MTINKNKYRHTSNRLKHWDYSDNGLYFITICTKNREQFFGNIINEKIELSEIGKIADQYWIEIPNHFKNISLDKHVIMPNHTHGIIIINNQPVETTDSDVYFQNSMQSQNIPKQTPKLGVSTQKWKPATIGIIINQFKRIVTINARKTNSKFAWQPRFYDHIIRNQQSCEKIKIT